MFRSRWLQRISLSWLIGLLLPMMLATAPARAETENVMLILDASGSMWGRVDNRPKIQIAREVIGQVLSDMGDKVNMGIIAYGHRKKGDCGDIQTIIPVGPVNAKAYMSVINKIKPKGKTPITDAVRRGAEELRFSEEKATVVLISDGLETCDADPCVLASELEEAGVDFTVHVVGFDLKDEDTSKLQCLAEKTGGKYLAADNANELSDAIGTVVAEVKAPEPVAVAVAPAPKPAPVAGPTTLKVSVHLAEGSPEIPGAYIYVIPASGGKSRKNAVASGNSNHTRKIAAGDYYVETVVGQAAGSSTVTVKAGTANNVQVYLNAVQLSVDAVLAEGGKPLKDAYIYIYDPDTGKEVSRGNQRYTFTVPAGKRHIKAHLGQANAGKVIETKPGEKHDVTIVLDAGQMKVNATSEEGGEPLEKAYIYAYDLETGKEVTRGNQRYTFTIPAGSYRVLAQLGKARAEKEVEIGPGEKLVVPINLGSGILKVTAVASEGGEPLKRAYVYIYEPKKQADGSRKKVTSGSQRHDYTLSAGKYFVFVQLEKAQAGQEVDVPAGKRTEITIVLGSGILKVNVLASEGGEKQKKAYIYIDDPTQQADGKRKNITAGNQRNNFDLPAGKYFVTAVLGKSRASKEIEVIAGKRTEAEIILGAGILKVDVLAEEGGKPLKDAYVYVMDINQQADGKRKQITAGNQRNNFTLPAGKYFIVANVGKVRASKEIVVTAGKRTDAQIIAGVGTLKVTVVPAPGAKPLKSVRFDVYEPEKQMDGSRKRIVASRSGKILKLPAGKFRLVAFKHKAQGMQEVEIVSGKMTEVTVNINAGALLVSASKSGTIELFSAQKNMDGTRDRIHTFRPGSPVTIQAGSYVMQARLGDKKVDQVVEITAGKLTEVTLADLQ